MIARVALVTVLALPLPAAPAAAAPRYVGYLGDGAGRAFHIAGQGGLHILSLTDSEFSGRRYRVCIRGGEGKLRRCFRRRLRSGYSGVNVSRIVNDRGGPGRYRARWYVGRRAVATWRFRLRPEGV